MTAFFADDIFFITRPAKRKPVARQYRATWPCGSTWEFDRSDLDIPRFENGNQTGVTDCYDNLADALRNLPGDSGCTVERLS